MQELALDRRVFYAGAEIIKQGTAGTEMFVIEKGRVEIWKGSADQKTVLGEIGPGAVFGEMALIDERPRMANATALDETVCKVVDKALFNKNMKLLDPFMAKVVEVLTKNVRSLSGQIDSMI